jgi:hypothetical protein
MRGKPEIKKSGAPNGRTRVKIEKKTRSADLSVFREVAGVQELQNETVH